MTAQERKERTEEMINRVYADLPADVRQQMIDAELRALTPDSGIGQQVTDHHRNQEGTEP